MKRLEEEFERIAAIHDEDDNIREQVINLSRAILKPSKQAIYAVHRDELPKAENLIQEAKTNINKVNDLLEASHGKDVGAFNAALEEFTEAVIYFTYIKEKKIPSMQDLNVTYHIYLPALCDFSGEIARRAVSLATKGEYDTVEEYNKMLEELYGFFLKIDFRSGEMRKKIESLKYGLSKVNQVLYDIKVKRV